MFYIALFDGVVMLNKKEIAEKCNSYTTKELAEFYGVSYTQMLRFLKNKNLKSAKKYKGILISEIKSLCKEMTMEELANYFNLSLTEIRGVCNYYGLRCKRVRHSNGIKADRNEMIIFLCQKYNYEAVANVFGITKQRVEQINKMYGEAK